MQKKLYERAAEIVQHRQRAKENSAVDRHVTFPGHLYSEVESVAREQGVSINGWLMALVEIALNERAGRA